MEQGFNNIDTFVISLPGPQTSNKCGRRFANWDDSSILMVLTKNTKGTIGDHRCERLGGNAGAKLTLGHQCYMAHVKLWEKIGDMKKPVLICEDDVSFTKDFPRALQMAIATQADWDICRFGKIRSVGAIKAKAIEQFRLNYYWGPFTGNVCYLIQPNVASRLANSFIPITRAHDHELNRFFFHDVRLTGLEPFGQTKMVESYITGN